MKNTLFAFLLLASLKSFSQTNDSVWMERYLQNYSEDTGTYLPDVPLFERNGASTSLKNYRGKLVYIDFWASWCGNCIIRFPHAEQLRKRLAVFGLDTLIQFVYINVDDSPKERRRAMRKYQPAGVNLYSGDTSIYSVWNISAIPRYILLDTSGRILAKRMASPDDGIVDYLLYAASKSVRPIEAVQIYFEQNRLIEKHRSADGITDKDFKEWYVKVLPSKYAYHVWNEKRKRD